jgi:hypothetical protein
VDIDPRLDTPFSRFFARRGFVTALAIAAILGTSTMLLGFFIDDYVHILSLEGKVPSTSTYDLFNFASGEPGAIEEAMGFLPFPWFTSLDARLHFFRPFSCATMALDHALFGRNPAPYHFHSMLWYVAYVAACWLVLRRALPAPLAGFAIVLFALDFGHVFATAWWSNRNALVAATPAVLGLWAHMRWREENWRPGLPLSLLGYGLGMLGGETAICVFGYVGAYELIGDRGPLRRRLAALVPGIALGLVYIIYYKLNHYGTHGSGVYIDPADDPLKYLAHAPERILMSIATQFFMVPVELPVGAAALFWPILVLSAAATGLVIYLTRHAWRDFDDDTHRGLIWLVTGALLSLAPVLSTFASARLMLVPSIGATALLAAILLHLRAAHAALPLRLIYGALIVLHVVVAPLAWPALSIGLARLDAVMRTVIARTEIDNATAAEKIVIVPVAPDPMLAMYTVILREYDGLPRVKSWHALSMAQCAHRISRPAANRLELELVDGEFLETVFEGLMRDASSGFSVGERIVLPQMTVEILSLGKRSPNRVAFEFHSDLDEPPYAFLGWKEDRLAQITPPAIGASVDVPRSLGTLDKRLLFHLPAE